jgi:hypothetical protein
MDGGQHNPGSGHKAPEAASDRFAGRSPSGNGHSEPPGEALTDAARHFAQLKEYFGHYVSAKLDGVKLTFRRLIIFMILGVVGLLAGGTMIIAAAVMLLQGLANAIGAIFDPDKPWVGQLIVSVLVLGGVVGGTMLLVRKMTGASKSRTVAKYDLKHDQQRERFGQDVAAAARESA